MASVRTFQIRVADGTVVTLTTTVPGTLSIEFPPLHGVATPGVHIDPQERPDNLTIPITIDKPFQAPEPSDPESSSGDACIHKLPKQPTKEELKRSLEENNIVPLDLAYKHNNPPAPEIYRPFDYVVDYEECLRKGSRANTPFISTWKPDPNKTTTENLASLPCTPPEISWRMSPQASINFPGIYLNAHPTTDGLISLLKIQPYEFAPPHVLRPRRDYPVPGKILYRMLELGWIPRQETVWRWLDIDWFSLRDYLAHLRKAMPEGRVAVWRPIYSEKEKKMMGGGKALTLEQRRRARYQKASSAEDYRWQMECTILQEEQGVDSEESVVVWFRKNGYGWVVDRGLIGECTAKPHVNQEIVNTVDKASTTGNDGPHSESSTLPPSPAAGATSAFRASAIFPIPASDPHTPTSHGPIRSLTLPSSSDAEGNDHMDVNGSEAVSESEMGRTSAKRRQEDEQEGMYESDSADETSKRRKLLPSSESLATGVSSVAFPVLSPHTPHRSLPHTTQKYQLAPLTTPSNVRAMAIPDSPRDEMGPRSVHPLQMRSPTPSRQSPRLSIPAAQPKEGSGLEGRRKQVQEGRAEAGASRVKEFCG